MKPKSWKPTPATVYGARLGGAAAGPSLTDNVIVAPLRTRHDVEAAELRAGWAPSEPWDPWPPQRVGYGGGDLFLPPPGRMARLRTYLGSQYGVRFDLC